MLQRANSIFREKSNVRGQMWLEFPPSDKIRELRERVTRLEHAYKKREASESKGERGVLETDMVEDALDLINYAAFFVKQITRGMSG